VEKGFPATPLDRKRKAADVGKEWKLKGAPTGPMPALYIADFTLDQLWEQLEVLRCVYPSKSLTDF
tara:strand:- start:15 stop:212 length:198 start_codon:yes stop_codon:yes gene_type:complete